MKTEINPESLYWASFNRFELRLPGQCVIDCSHSGACDEDVTNWTPKIREQVARDVFPNAPTDQAIREQLEEYGAWDDEALQDAEENWRRLVWCAACNVAEESEPDCSQPITK